MAAPEANQLLGVSMEAGAANATVLIQTAQPVGYRYTVYDASIQFEWLSISREWR